MIDFWTYKCINCIHTFPFLKEMHARYSDDGLVIVGVRDPEFEKSFNICIIEHHKGRLSSQP